MISNVSKKTLQSQETRAKIVAAAEEIFLEKGFEATTIKLISDRAGIAYSTSYTYFENKATIFTVVVDETIKHLYAMARHPFFPTTVKEAYDIILNQSTIHLEITESRRDMMIVIQEAIHSSKLLREKWNQVKEYFIGTITQDITYSRNAGLVRPAVIPSISASGWYAVNEWFLWEILNEPSKYNINTVAKAITSDYVHSIYIVDHTEVL